MDNKKYSGVGVGSTSIIMIFVVLCLTTFSVLSLTSANVGKRYSEKLKINANQKIDAQNEANQLLIKIDMILLDASRDLINYEATVQTISSLDGVKVTNQTDAYIASFDIPINKTRFLSVELKIPSSPSDERYEIIKWITTSTEADYDENPDKIWDGN